MLQLASQVTTDKILSQLLSPALHQFLLGLGLRLRLKLRLRFFFHYGSLSNPSEIKESVLATHQKRSLSFIQVFGWLLVNVRGGDLDNLELF